LPALDDRGGASSKTKSPEIQRARDGICRAIADIRIGEHHRRDMGDIDRLAASGELIAGERRLQPAESLCRERIPVTVIDPDSVVRGEFAENACRKDFPPTELVAIGQGVERTERAQAKARKVHDGRPGKLPDWQTGDAREKVAAQLGVSGRQYVKAKAVVAAAEAEPEKNGLLADMDRTGRVNEPEVIAIVVHPAGKKPGYYDARLAEGKPVIAASRTPFFDAARRLRDLGMDGAAVLVMRNADSNTECLRATIAVAATTTVEESAHGPVFRRHRTGSSGAVEAPSMRSGSRAGSHPSRTVGGATDIVGTDIASPLVVRHVDSPIEATTELAGAEIVEESAHGPVFRRHRIGFGPGQTPREPLPPEAAAADDDGLEISAFHRRNGGAR
jgi:hypothetical protein